MDTEPTCVISANNIHIKSNICVFLTVTQPGSTHRHISFIIFYLCVSVFTDGCIAAQSFVFLLAGSESVSTAGSFCLYSIASHPHVQKRLQQEVDAVLQKHKGQWNFDTIKDMKYLDQVFNGISCLYSIG